MNAKFDQITGVPTTELGLLKEDDFWKKLFPYGHNGWRQISASGGGCEIIRTC